MNKSRYVRPWMYDRMVELKRTKISFQQLKSQKAKKSQKAYSTRDSQAVSDPSTNRAQRCLTSQIGRDGVLSTWYGRKHSGWMNIGLITNRHCSLLRLICSPIAFVFQIFGLSCGP